MKSQTGEAALLGGVRGLLGGLRGWQLFWDTRAMERGRRLVLKNKQSKRRSLGREAWSGRDRIPWVSARTSVGA